LVYRPANLIACEGIEKNEISCAVSTLPIFRDRNRPDVGVPIDTQGQCAACLLR
jgi:hypothetical protein